MKANAAMTTPGRRGPWGRRPARFSSSSTTEGRLSTSTIFRSGWLPVQRRRSARHNPRSRSIYDNGKYLTKGCLPWLNSPAVGKKTCGLVNDSADDPIDVARSVEFLLGDGGRNVTGTTLTIDAGNTA